MSAAEQSTLFLWRESFDLFSFFFLLFLPQNKKKKNWTTKKKRIEIPHLNWLVQTVTFTPWSFCPMSDAVTHWRKPFSHPPSKAQGLSLSPSSNPVVHASPSPSNTERRIPHGQDIHMRCALHNLPARAGTVFLSIDPHPQLLGPNCEHDRSSLLLAKPVFWSHASPFSPLVCAREREREREGGRERERETSSCSPWPLFQNLQVWIEIWWMRSTDGRSSGRLSVISYCV